MDPNATLARLIIAIQEGDIDNQNLQALYDWLVEGDFIPEINRDALIPLPKGCEQLPMTATCTKCGKDAEIDQWVPSVHCTYCDHSEIQT